MDKTEIIVNHLQEKYHPEGIVLHGSRARNQARSNSDWDIVVLTKEKQEGGTEVFAGENLDVDIVVLPIDSKDIVSHFGSSLRIAKVLLDNKDAVAKHLIETAQKLYQAGRKLTEREYLNKKNMMLRTLQRLHGYETYPEAFFLHLGWFYEQALNNWFNVKGEWSEPVYEALPEIQRRDPEYYKHVQTLATDSPVKEKLSVAEKVYKTLFK